MILPTVANCQQFLYAAGNTPATNLLKDVPQGPEPVALLLLGCGDVRNIFYTAHANAGFPARKLDITCCDLDANILARNILLLSFLVGDDEAVIEASALWALYYELYVPELLIPVIHARAAKLASASASASSWNHSPYKSRIEFSDQATRSALHAIWNAIAAKSTPGTANSAKTKSAFAACIKQTLALKKDLSNGQVLRIAARATSPVIGPGAIHVVETQAKFWEKPSDDDGTVFAPNPMFSAILSKTEILHYANNPLFGYHLATGLTALTESSPLRIDDAVKGEKRRVAMAAKVQFEAWAGAVRKALESKMTLRFVAADAFTFCHTLQHALATGNMCAGLYRTQWNYTPLTLDPLVYGEPGNAPTRFDVINTSNLADHFKLLNVLVSAMPLLRHDAPHATLHTETLLRRNIGSGRSVFDQLLCGDAPTIFLLLNASPVEYWAGMSTTLDGEEAILGHAMLNDGSEDDKLYETYLRLSWKHNHHLAGQVAPVRMQFDNPRTLANVILAIYLQMFEFENPMQLMSLAARRPRSASDGYAAFHREGLVALLKRVRDNLTAAIDFKAVCVAFLDSMALDKVLVLASSQAQELASLLDIQGVHSSLWLRAEIKRLPSLGGMHAWEHIPSSVAVTVVMPRRKLNALYAASPAAKRAPPLLQGSIRSGPSNRSQWHNMFGSVHLALGRVETKNSRGSEDFAVCVVEDPRGWDGDAPLVASWFVPAAALQVEPRSALVGLCVQPGLMAATVYKPVLGKHNEIWETRLDDKASVFLSKTMPGQTQLPVLSGAGATGREEEEMLSPKSQEIMDVVKISALPSRAGGVIESLSGLVSVGSAEGQSLLGAEKAPVELQQEDPFTINVVFGKAKAEEEGGGECEGLVLPMRFPLPVSAAGAKTRIDRKSMSVGVIAPLAEPGKSESVIQFLAPTFPPSLAPSGVPTPLNMAHLNLDDMPALDLSEPEKMTWFATTSALQFTPREQALRKIASQKAGVSDSPRLDIKDSLHTMLSLTAGTQGGQTGLFSLSDEELGIHMLFIVSAIRLDPDARSVVLDAAVIPLTMALVADEEFKEFLMVLSTLQMCQVNTSPDELRLWKRSLPAMVERCRTWEHNEEACEYRVAGVTVPLGLEPGGQVICSCGRGKFPARFVSLPCWDGMAAKEATRVAISPLFGAGMTEDAIDPSLIAGYAGETGEAVGAGGAGEAASPRCHVCGKAGSEGGKKLKRCMRCLKTRYCGAECQRKDWKRHKMECAEAPDEMRRGYERATKNK